MTKSGSSSRSGQARAREQFSKALERVTTLDEAWRFVLSQKPGVEANGRADRASRLSHFLKHLTPPPTSTRDDLQAYLALIRRFLSSGAMDPATAKPVIAALMHADAERADTK